MPSISEALALLSLVGASFASPAGNGRRAHDPYTTTALATAPTPPGTTESCGAYHLVTPGETCMSIAMYGGLTFEQFRELNPAVNAKCTNLVPGYQYCIGKVTKITPRSDLPKTSSVKPSPTPTRATPVTPVNTYASPPGPTKEGASPCCREWYTVREGDTCLSIDHDHGITFNEFRTWNPNVNGKCSNLWVGYSYCVDADANCTPNPPTTTHTPVATPSPVQVGMTGGCTQFYEAQPGDYCQAIAWRFGIDVATFISWNPGVGADCTGLLTGYYYCVAK